MTLYQNTDIMNVDDENDNTTAFTGDANVPLSFIKNQRDSMGHSCRWYNHGCTPDEVLRQAPIHPEVTTIVQGSSRAAAILTEGQEQLGQMGINIDLDATATDISYISFENGINGKMTKTTRKVYPNDLCPCGSGKKFKKCCGKF